MLYPKLIQFTWFFYRYADSKLMPTFTLHTFVKCFATNISLTTLFPGIFQLLSVRTELGPASELSGLSQSPGISFNLDNRGCDRF